MGTARASAKNIFLNERGNLTVTIFLIVMITGAVGYFMTLSDHVDDEIRVLGGTQATSFLKSDVQETLKRTLRDGNSGDCVLGNSIRDMFRNMQLPSSQSIFNREVKRPNTSPSTKEAYVAYLASVNDQYSCFFHPARYGAGVEFNYFKIEMKRSANPNMVNLSNYITAEVLIRMKAAGRSFSAKYLLRFQVDVHTMASYGVIFSTGSSTTPVFSVANPDTQVTFDSKVLLDQTDRSKPVMLSRLTEFNQVKYTQKVNLAASNIVTDSNDMSKLQEVNLREIFKEGVVFDAFPDRNQVVPWALSNGQYNDLFNYDLLAVGRYPLPRLLSNESAMSTSSGGITHLYSKDKEKNDIPGGIESVNKNTKSIYELMTGDQKNLYKSCSSVDVTTGVYNLIIFNNLNEDFTIDFSQNSTLSTPPVFCGLIAARNLTIILNGSAAVAEAHTHHLVGKLLISGQIRFQSSGKFVFTDILDLDQDTVSPYEIMDDHTSVQIQYFNQRYYSAQNFTLPFFKDPSIYTPSGTDYYTTHANRFWVPRDTKELFTRPCNGKMCRYTPIGSPDTPEKILQLHSAALLYEVRIVE